jgi:hypothetical protein
MFPSLEFLRSGLIPSDPLPGGVRGEFLNMIYNLKQH